MSLDQDPTEPFLVNVLIEQELLNEIGSEGEKVIYDTVNDYVQLYGSPRDSIVFKKGDFKPEIAVSADGSQQIVIPEEQAAKGIIFVDPSRSTNMLNLRNMIAHACTHALKSDYAKAVQPQMPINDQLTLYGIHGFALVVEPIEKEFLTKLIYAIEEGACEALASNLYPKKQKAYSTNDKRYFDLGRLTNELLEISNISHVELAKLVQNNDLYGFVRGVLNVTRVERKHIMFILNAYNNVLHRHNVEDIYRIIIENRIPRKK